MPLGLFFFVNAFYIGLRIWPGWFAAALLLDGLLSLAAAFGRAGWARALLCLKATAFLAVAVTIALTDGRAEMAIGLLVGAFLIIDAVARISMAHLTRGEGWRRVILYAAVELMLGIWTLVSYPADGVIGSDVSLLLMNSAFSLCVRATNLRRQPGTPASLAPAQP